MKKESPSTKPGSQSIDDPRVTPAEPEWIGKVLSITERVTAGSPTSPQAGKPVSEREKT